MAKEMMHEIGNSVSKEISNMKAKMEVSPIREDLEALKQDAIVLRDDARTLGKDLKAEGKKQLTYAEQRAREVLDDAKEKGKDQYAEIANFISNNPGQSLAIAFVGGIVVNMLLGRRR